MSRSRKKTPVFGMANRKNSEKEDKVLANKRFRRKSKMKILHNIENIPFRVREVSDVWSWSHDGMFYLSSAKDSDMRK